MSGRYRGYDVLDKWSSPSFDTLTRGVLRQRLHCLPERRFFTEDEWALVEAISARLAPRPEGGGQIPITPWIDADLHANRGQGFRAPDMPPLQLAWRLGLAGFAAEVEARWGRPFQELSPQEQDTQLRRVQAGEIDKRLWRVPAERFFDDLLKAVVGAYYAHPAAWSEMGFGGPASPRGYVRLGLDEHDPWEAKELKG
jgi:hypothetical protein